MNNILLIVIYIAFISLGLPDGVFGIAWPSMRQEFAVPLQAAGMIGIILMFCSAISSFASGAILRRFGTGRIVLVSGLMTGFALLGYAMIPSFFWLVIAALPLGFGQGAVDSGLNHYVANNYSSRHMNWLHCFWGMGATLGPLIMTRTLAANHSWRFGYTYIAIIQLTLALIFLMSQKLWKKEQNKPVKVDQEKKRRAPMGFKQSGPWLGMALFFIYAGVEYVVGLWACSMLVESRGLPKAAAGLWVSYFYGALMIGRFMTGLIVNKLGNRALVRIGLSVAVFGTALVFLPGLPLATMFGLILLGLGFAPIYPCMMHEVPNRFDEKTTQVLIGYQVGAACLGASIIPAGLGLLFAKISLELLVPSLAVLLVAMIVVSEVQNRMTPLTRRA